MRLRCKTQPAFVLWLSPTGFCNSAQAREHHVVEQFTADQMLRPDDMLERL